MKRLLLVGAMLLLAAGIATIVALGWLIGEALPALLAFVPALLEPLPALVALPPLPVVPPWAP